MCFDNVTRFGMNQCRFVLFDRSWLGCDIGGAKELGVIYFPTNWGAKESQNLPNHRVVGYCLNLNPI